MEVCRACLGIEDDMVPLDEALVTAYNLLTNLNVTLLDAMPQYVCKSCSQTVKFYMEFRERCITTETSLQEVIFREMKSDDEKPLSEIKTESNKIKQEIEDENDNFDFGANYFGEEFVMQVKTENNEKPIKREIKPKKSKHKKKSQTKKIKQKLEACKQLPCGLCQQSFTELTCLSAHIESHNKSRSCGLCYVAFNTWPSLLGHRFTHIPKKEFKCHVCKKKMVGEEAKAVVKMEYHYMYKHYNGEKTKLSCKQCLRSYETPRKLSKHITSVHSKNLYTCDHCHNIYNNKQRLITHIRCHSDTRSFVCETCGFASKHSGGLRDHRIRRHAPDKVKCSDCGRWFATTADRDKHVCGRVLRICPICGKQFDANKSLNRHMLQHSSVKRYKCLRCPAAYKTRGALVAHNNRHDGIRPNQCPYCPQKFYTPSVLIKHKRIHTGEKPYVCKVCNKGFTGNNNLKVHMKVHGEYLVVKRNKYEDSTNTPRDDGSIELE